MQQRLEVQTARELRKRTRLLVYFFWPFALLSLWGVVASIRDGKGLEDILIFAIPGLVCAVGPFFLYALRYREVRVFDAEGVTTRTGRRFRWDRFVRIEDVKRRRIGHNHYDLHFEDGTCAIADLMADNYNEVRAVAAELTAGKNPFTGAPVGVRARG
jgi:hypothetical protein